MRRWHLSPRGSGKPIFLRGRRVIGLPGLDAAAIELAVALHGALTAVAQSAAHPMDAVPRVRACGRLACLSGVLADMPGDELAVGVSNRAGSKCPAEAIVLAQIS